MCGFEGPGGAVLFAQLRDLRHAEVCDLLVSPDGVAPLVEVCEFERGAEAHADGLAAAPVAQHLLRQVVAEPGDEDGQDLRPRVLNQPADAGLRAQVRVRVRALVARALGVEADDVARALEARRDAIKPSADASRASS